MYILLVEDHQDIGSSIQTYLQACDRSCDRVKTVWEAKWLLQKNMYDVAVLDRMLPDGSGEQLCRWIKDAYALPVILQTAKTQIEDTLEWFDAWADDYLKKPYDLRELEARIKVLNNEKWILSNEKLRLWWLQFDLLGMRVFQEQEEIHCSAHEWIVLKLLLENPWEVVSRSTLVDYIWGSDGFRDAENKLDVLISGMRKKLGKQLIETVKGFGYRIKA